MDTSNPYEAPHASPSPPPDAEPVAGAWWRPRFVELVLVLGILGVLVALLIPATRSSRGAARRAQCVNNLKQITLALANYESEHGALPPAYTVDADGRPLHSWRTLILPYLEQGELYRSIDLTKPWNDPANARALAAAPSVYHCPGSEGKKDTTTYLATTAPAGCLKPGAPRPLKEITDDHGSTLAVFEAGEEDAVPWMAPVDAPELLFLTFGPDTKVHHPGGANAAMLDGSVKFLKVSLPPKVRRAVWSVAGGETVQSEEY